MAFCTNCGASMPDGTAFCTECGARIISAPQINYGASRPAKSKTPLILGISCGVLAALVILVLFLTGVLGGPKGPVGTWELNAPINEDGDTYTLVLEKNGIGYLEEIVYYPRYNEVDHYYYPVQWVEGNLRIMDDLFSGDNYSFVWNGEALSFENYGDYLQFHRTVKKATDGSKPAEPGTYQVTEAYDGNDSMLSEVAGSTITVNAGGTAILNMYSETMQLTWDQHFFYDKEDGYPVYYRYENGALTLIYGARRIVFSRMR
jgi:hypothetical protein